MTQQRFPPDRGPLDGIRILSLAEQLPGPFATLLLADLGADVILVERPDTGDPARSIPDLFAALARNKRSIALDLKSAKGNAQFQRLVATSDVVMEGYSPGIAQRLGIGYEQLCVANPKLIYVSISGYGQSGPYRDRVGHDLSFQGIAGLLADHAESPGATPAFPLADIAAGLFAAVGVLSALQGLQRMGKGTFIDVAMSDALVSMMTPLLGPAMNGSSLVDAVHSPGYGTFGCADGAVLSLSIVHEDHFWRSLCDVVGLPQLAVIPHAERMRDAVKLRSEIRREIVRRTLPEWHAIFDAARIPWAPVHALADVPMDPHLVARGLFDSINGPSGKAQRFVTRALQFSAWPRIDGMEAPALGEHNESILFAP